MNQSGGVQHLDNKRNAIRPSGWSKYKVKPANEKLKVNDVQNLRSYAL